MTLLKSIEVCSNTDKKLEFYLDSEDVSDLPIEDVPVGSTAHCVDTGVDYVFHAKSKTWYEKNPSPDNNG